ncbi:hypothetical protein [Methanolapillus africanus]|uniref:hypothetical protein n=1 Tax=Methanolapillus africanus TaxID=3028297 RepID=UPI0030B8C207
MFVIFWVVNGMAARVNGADMSDTRITNGTDANAKFVNKLKIPVTNGMDAFVKYAVGNVMKNMMSRIAFAFYANKNFIRRQRVSAHRAGNWL